MKIGVCIKHVPDTATAIRVNDSKTGIVEDNVKFVISPYDEIAVEEALKTKEKTSAEEVVVYSVGLKRSQEGLRSALAMGCDRAVHLVVEDSATVDSLAVAKILAAQIKKDGAGLVFTGRHAVDDDNAQVSQMVAEILKWPCVTVVSKFDLMDGNQKARIEREVSGGAKEVWEVEFPAVIAANKGLNEPRYASLKGIMAAKKKPMEEVKVGDLGLSSDDLKPKVQVSNYRLPPERAAGKIFKDDPKQAVEQVVKLLREEAKVI